MRRIVGCTLVVAAFVSSIAFAEDKSGEKTPVGFRGNWTGAYPQAAVPTQWGKVSPLMAGLRCQADKPADDQPAGVTAMYGQVGQWLIAGPIPPADAATKPIDDKAVADEAGLAPREGQEIRAAAWKKFATEKDVVDLLDLLGKDATGLTFAHTYIYSPQEGKVLLRFKHYGPLKAYVNGKLVYPTGGGVATLNKGWNRLLCKIASQKQGQYEEWPSLWHFGVNIAAVMPFEAQTKNILWQARLPGFSVSSPLVVGDRVFCLAEPYDLVCVSRKDGKVLWIRSNNFYEALSDDEKNSHASANELADLSAKLQKANAEWVANPANPAKDAVEAKLPWSNNFLEKKISELIRKADAENFGASARMAELHGNTLSTPVSDGKNVYVWLGCGVAACYDLDGNRKWITYRHIPIKHHGFNSSPILMEGKFIFYMRKLFALDAATGKEAWAIDIVKGDEVYGDSFHDSLIRMPIGGKDFIYAHGTIVNPADGKVAWEGQFAREGATIPTPIIADGSIFHLTAGGKLYASKLPSPGAVGLKNECNLNFFKGGGSAYTRTFMCASPLYHDGLLYIVDCMGNLSVVDARTFQIVYQKDLGMGLEVPSRVHSFGTCYASPVLAGKHIYVFGMSGTSVVIEPGRQFKLVARNKIEHVTYPGAWYGKPEGFSSTPVPDGKDLFIRGDEYLYCVGEK
ncbi:MAG: PQQ-binding-like beta-propeller repeat protein [Phycisphaerae bacterium]